MRSPSGIRALLRSSILVAHDPRLAACRPLVAGVMAAGEALHGSVVVTSSAQDAAEQLRAARDGKARFDLAVVCLDLQPAPVAGARIADFAVRQGLPVILVARSLRWLPPDAGHLKTLQCISPDADASVLGAALANALHASPAADRDPEDRVSIGF